jgi:SprT protein
MKIEILIKYIPESSIQFITNWLSGFDVQVDIKNPRKNRLGDYRFSTKTTPHQISVNNNLDKNLFFLVLTHEIAHLLAFSRDRKILPHGKEWKTIFSQLIIESLTSYSEDLQPILIKFSKNPKANFYSDSNLAFYFVSKNSNYLNLNNIKIGEKFKLKNKTFIKLQKKNTKYLCEDITTRKKYLVHQLAQIQTIE